MDNSTPSLADRSAPFGMACARLVQHHREGRALAGLRGDGKLAAVPIEDVLDDGEPKTGAALLPARRHVDPVEPLGQARQMLGRDAGPIIDHGDGVAPGLAAERGDVLGLDLHMAAALAVFERVLHQVLEHLKQLVAIAAHDRRPREAAPPRT